MYITRISSSRGFTWYYFVSPKSPILISLPLPPPLLQLDSFHYQPPFLLPRLTLYEHPFRRTDPAYISYVSALAEASAALKSLALVGP